MSFNEKSVLKEFNRKQLALFSRSNKKSLTIYPASKIPLVTFARNATTYTKESFDTAPPGAKKIDLEFIYHEEHYREVDPASLYVQTEDEDDSSEVHINPDRKQRVRSWFKEHFSGNNHRVAENFVWHTSQAKVREAIFHGIMNVQAPTAQVINTLGTYRLKALSRVYEKGIISNKYHQKNEFLQYTQERIEALQGLERLMNLYNESATVDENFQTIMDRMDDYVSQLHTLKLRYQDPSKTKILCAYDEQAQQKMGDQINLDIKKLEDYRGWLKTRYNKNKIDKTLLRDQVLNATGHHSMLGFIKQRMIYATRQLQEHNQNMTYSLSAKSLLRGDLNSYCEDALKIVFDYLPDQHNPILAAHQGIYVSEDNNQNPTQNPSSPKKEQQVTVDFHHLESKARNIRQALMALANIEGIDRIESTQSTNDEGYQEYELRSNGKPKKLLTTRFTKWATNASAKYVAKRVLAWVWNITTGIIVGLAVDLLVGFIGGLFKLNPPSFAQKLRWTPENERNVKTKYHEMEEKITMPITSLGTKFGRLVGNFFRNTIYEFIKGFRIVFKEAKIELFDGLKSDFKIGHYGIPDEIDIIAKVNSELTSLYIDEKKYLRKIKKDINKFNPQKDDSQNTVIHPLVKPAIKPEDIQRIMATAPYDLSPGEYSDMLNASCNGVKYFIENFTHEIHTKHPFTGLMFNLFYIAGGLAVLAPGMMAFLGPKYLAFSNALGATVGKSTASKALSSALYQAEIVQVVMDTAMHGHDGTLANVLKMLEEDPSNAVLYFGLAVGLGYLIAFELNIPGFSEEIRNDLGTVPIAALAVAGAKIGILVYELLEAEEEIITHEATNNDIREQFKKKLQDQFPTLKQQDITQKVDQILDDQTLFMMRIEKKKHLLPHIKHETKRELIELMSQKFPDNPEMRKAMTNQLFPERKKSIFVITLTAIFGYIPMIFRCLLTIVTWSKEPWIQLGEKIVKDVSRLINVINKLAKVVVDFIKVNLRIIADIFVNEIVARIEGLVRDKKHSVSIGSYRVSAGFDSTYDQAREVIGAPLDKMKKVSTSPHGHKLSQHEYNDVMASLYKPRRSPTVTTNTVSAEDFSESKKHARFCFTDKKLASNYFQNYSIFNRGPMGASEPKIDNMNQLVRGMKSHQHNYEIIRDLIINNAKVADKNLHYNSSELMQLALLDQSGRVAVDFLRMNYGRTISDRIFSTPVALQQIISGFYDNHRVISALRVQINDTQRINKKAHGIRHDIHGIRFCFDTSIGTNHFISSVNGAMDELLNDDIRTDQTMLQALAVLQGLFKPLSTQTAVARYISVPGRIWSKAMSEPTQNPAVLAARKTLRARVNFLAQNKKHLAEPLGNFDNKYHEVAPIQSPSVVNL